MSKLHKYFFAEHPDLPGAGFIVASDAPCYIGKVLKFNNLEDYDRFLQTSKHPFKTIEGYMMAIQFFGILGTEQKSVEDPGDLEAALVQMANFYKERKILVNEKYYNRNMLK